MDSAWNPDNRCHREPSSPPPDLSDNCLTNRGVANGRSDAVWVAALWASPRPIPDGWRIGERAEAAAQDVVATVTPGQEPVVFASDLRSGQHLAVLGADAKGKAELEPAA